MKSLPKTRREQFFKILKNNKLTFLKIGLICLVYLLPLLAIIATRILYISFLYESGNYSNEEIVEFSKIASVLFNALLIPCLIIFSIGLCGILKVYRRLIWNEQLSFKDDFKQGIKDSAWKFALFSFLIGIIYLGISFAYHYLPDNLRFITYILVGMMLVIIIPIIFLTAYVSSIYIGKIGLFFKTAGKLYIRRTIWTVLILAGLYACYFLRFIPINIYIYLPILVFLIVFIFPIWILISYMNSIRDFDDFINTYYYPDKAFLGLEIDDEKKSLIEERTKLVKTQSKK